MLLNNKGQDYYDLILIAGQKNHGTFYDNISVLTAKTNDICNMQGKLFSDIYLYLTCHSKMPLFEGKQRSDLMSSSLQLLSLCEGKQHLEVIVFV